MTTPLPLYADAELGAYGYHEKEWFQPHVRLRRFLRELDERGLREAVTFRQAPPATDDELLLFHTPAHIDHVRRECATNEGHLDHGPTFARAHVERAATHVVGAVMDAIRRIVAGEMKTAFIPIAGFHHAHPEQARLYCLYNDPAIAISWLLSQLEGNVAYIDIDIHQGDGVYEGFAGHPRVWIADLHEDPSTLFPHTPESPGRGPFSGRREDNGRGAGAGTKMNIPLEPHTTDAAYLSLWEEAEGLIRSARPEFIVFESGVDGLEADPLSNQRLSPDVIGQVCDRVVTLAHDVADGRLLVLGGGGYHLDATSRGWASVVESLVAHGQPAT